MKTTICFILALSTFVLASSLNSFAQNPRPVVRLIYFLPKNRQPQQDIDTKMDALIKDVQRVYADEMERHGLGRKTFQIETDATGKAVLYRVNGQFTDAYYQKNWNRVGDEISKKFDLSKNIYVASMETNSESLCGLGAAHSSMGGSMLIPSSGLCFGIGATTHELGHVFGLDHDFRNNLYHMSYGADWEKNQFSQCAAEWLNVHRAFNSVQTVVDEPATIKMLRPSIESSSNAIRLRFEVTDPDGLHQAQLKADTTDEDPARGTPKLIDCKSLNGVNSTVEFVTSLLTRKNKFVYLSVMDAHGNFIRNQFPINVPVQRRPSTVVSIPDANLVAAIQEALDLAPNEPITTHAMSDLGVLSAPNRQITDLTGLEYARKLAVLNLNSNSILDISSLSELTQLTDLLLGDNSISDVSPLEKLVNLEKLSLGGNPIRNTSPVRALLRQNPNVQIDIDVSVDEPIDVLIDVLIYTGDVWWITPQAAIVEAKTTENLLESAGIRAKITDDENYVKQWMLQTTSDGSVDVLILYGPIPTTIYPPGNAMPDGSVAENWIETSDGNTILNHADYLGFWSTNTGQGRQQNGAGTLQNLMDIPSIFFPVDKDNIPMFVTADGGALTPSLVNFQSNRAFPLDRLQGDWFAEKILASNTGDAEATLADPVIVRNGNRGRIAIVHQTSFEDNPKGEVAAEIIINYLLPEPTEPKPDPPVGTGLIPDARLATAVREALRLGPSATLTKQAMQRLNTLNANVREIKNLTGLEHATQLEKLSLHGNQIRDLSPLADLSQLKELLLGSNQIQDVTPLAGLTRLENLSLSNNQIRDLSPLARLTQLEFLWLDQNNIRDVSSLRGLVNLERLKLGGNPITDTLPLSSLTKLNEVDVEITTPDVHVEATQHPPVYWVNTNNGTLHRLVNIKMENLVPNVRNVTSHAVDVVNEMLYWTEKTSNTTGRIRRANLDGTKVQLVKDLTSAPHSIALDTAAGKIYITNAWGKIQRLNVDGSNFQPNLITELDMPSGLALDVGGGKIYWTEASGRIRRTNLDGSNIQEVATGLGTPINIAVSGDTVYWTEKIGANTGQIQSANLNGNPTVMTLHTFPQGFPVGIAVDAVENKLYWTTSRGSIGRSNLDGSTSQPNFVTGLSAPGAFVLNVETPVDVETPDILTTDAVVSLSPSPVISPGVGEQLTLNVNIAEGEAVAGYQITVQFDATALRYVESSNGDYLPTGAFFVPPVVNGNRVKLASTALTGDSNGDGTLATLTFEVIVAKASTLNMSEVLLSDSDGSGVSPQVAGGQLTAPSILEGDVNNDGVVNIQDLVLVASSLGKTGPNIADVNADEIVDIRDLVKVAGALGNAAAAPSLHPQLLDILTARDVQQWLSQAQHLDMTDITSQRGIRFLEQLLTALIPKESALLANYPNPFNPETWIPYQLAKPANVTLTIYALNGQAVRTLSLGHQLAGTYQSRSRAAYWDGRNTVGEPVASGLYFYTLTAGDFSATRKMLIRK